MSEKPTADPIAENLLGPLHVFRFQVDFFKVPPSGGAGTEIKLCSGAFSECTGLEATMEPKVIKGGGMNYGAAQRAGPVTFGTVILKRGMTTTRDLWNWFASVNRGGKYAVRLNVIIRLFKPGEIVSFRSGEELKTGEPKAAVEYLLERALPIKFKAADLNARGTEVAVEELHLAHEGFHLKPA